MSTAIKFIGINFLDNPSPFTSPIKVKFWYECLEPLVEHIQWKLFYLQKDESDDLLLEEVWDGPVNLGPHLFLLEADAPDPSLLQKRYILGVQAIKLSGSYAGREFLQVCCLMSNLYDDENLRKEPPQNVLIDRVQRNISSTSPKIVRFPINFHPQNAQGGGQAAPDPGKRKRLRSRL